MPRTKRNDPIGLDNLQDRARADQITPAEKIKSNEEARQPQHEDESDDVEGTLASRGSELSGRAFTLRSRAKYDQEPDAVGRTSAQRGGHRAASSV